MQTTCGPDAAFHCQWRWFVDAVPSRVQVDELTRAGNSLAPYQGMGDSTALSRIETWDPRSALNAIARGVVRRSWFSQHGLWCWFLLWPGIPEPFWREQAARSVRRAA